MANITVTTLNDVVDAADNVTSLREAITTANGAAGADTITFDASLAAGTITLALGELTISTDITIDGDAAGSDNKADITINGNDASRVFNVTGGTSTLDALTITGGRVQGGTFGGGGSIGGSGQAAQGGGIFNAATLSIVNSTITGNEAVGGNGSGGSAISGSGGTAQGAGIYNTGTLTVTGSAISGNAGTGGTGASGGSIAGRGGNVQGSGIFNTGTVTATNTTIEGNGGTAGVGGGGFGGSNGLVTAGGIQNSYIVSYGAFSFDATVTHGSVTVGNSTITGNGGGLVNESYLNFDTDITTTGTISLSNSIILGNGSETSGAITATGLNIIGIGPDTNATDNIIQTTAIANVFATGLLADNGGPVKTVALTLAHTNPALDASNTDTPATDARGNARIDQASATNRNGSAADLGAFESGFVPPAASIVVADTALAIGETSLVTITFTEAVTGFTNADLTVANGTLSAVSTSDGGITWTATFTPSASTTDATNLITLDKAGVASVPGIAGTGTTDSNNYAIDTVRPTASIMVADSALRVGETSLVTITFSEAVTGFTNADLTIANGTLSAVSSSNGGITWTATLTPTASTTDATNLITLDNTGVTDAAGNAGTGTTDSNNYAIDTVRPTASIVVADTALAAGETSLVTITFSEAVSGFTNADLTIENGTLSAVSSSDGGITWTATLTPAASTTDATNLISLSNTGVADAAGNTGTGTTQSNNYAIDTARPTASVVVADTVLAAGETSLVTITFSEAVSGFTNADLTIENGTLSAVSSSDGGITWTATLTPSASTTDATNLITLDNTGVADAAGNSGTGTTDSNTYAIDTARPTATIVVADNALAIGETSLVTITFSEAVTGFTNADLTIANGTLSAVSSSDGGVTWTATLTPATAVFDATNVVTLDNTGVADAAGNAGTATTDSNNYAIDTAGPRATIVVADTVLAAGETSLVTITFSEAVTGFTNADLTIDNGTLSAVSSSDGGITWTGTLTPTTAVFDATNVITLDNTGVQSAAGDAGVGTTQSNNYALTEAASLVVTTLSDTVNAYDNVTSLREAIATANGAAGADTITFNASLSGGLIRLGSTLVITEALTIDGDIDDDNSADITITGDVNGDDTLVGTSRITDVAATKTASHHSDNVQVLNASTDLTLDGLIVTGGNSSRNGGGVQASGNLTATNSTFNGNSAFTGGGAFSQNTLTATNSTFSGNSSELDGGGAFADTLTATNSTFSRNSAFNGGGAYAIDTLTATNSTFSGNSAQQLGGGAIASTLTATNSTFSGNSAAFAGGGASASTITATNSIFMGNTATSGAEVALGSTRTLIGGNIIGTDVFQGNTDVGDTTASAVFAAVDANGAGVLADNGGPVQTIALNALVTNPALDASNTDAPATDARGNVRADQPGITNSNGSAADLGAFEVALGAAPTNIALSASATAEFAAAGTVVGSLSTTDADDTGGFTYTLVDDAGGRFVIDGKNLEVANGLSIDFEQAASHTVTIRTTDTLGASFEKSLTISVTDINPENVIGNAAANHFVGGAGNDRLDGGAGIDTLVGGLGNDAYIVNDVGANGRVVDILTELANQGTDGVRTSVAFNLNEARFANIENVYASGNAAINLGGSAAANVLIGNGAANALYGLGGRDVMRGEGGVDQFVFLNAGETGRTAATRDLIQDFTVGVDKINLSTIDANSVLAGNQDFNFLATQGAAFSGVAGQLRFFHEDNALDRTIVEGDVNGDRVADFQIELGAYLTQSGLKALTSSDFLL